MEDDTTQSSEVYKDIEDWPPYTYRDYPDITPENYRSFIDFLDTKNPSRLIMELQAWVSFCDSRCAFCYFPNEPFSKEKVDKYLLALKKELKMYAETKYIKSSKFDETVLGGGSSSVLSSDQLVDLISYCEKNFNVTEDRMVKVTGCTHNFDEKKLKAVFDYAKGARCVQADMGVQTFDDNLRKMLNIQDSAKEAERMIKATRRLGLYACIDLMYNLPGQTLEIFRKDVQKAIDLDAEGVDCYLLEVYPGTPLARQIQSGKVPPTGGSDVARKMYLEAYDLFEKAGYKPNGHSRFSRVVEHLNERCVKGWPWSGILTTGAGCFMGYLGKYSYENIGPSSAYIDMVNRKRFPIVRLSVSSEADDMRKTMMRLYIRQPVNKRRFRKLFGKSPEEVFPDAIKKLKAKGLIEVDDNEIRLTKKGDVWRYNIAWEFGPQE